MIKGYMAVGNKCAVDFSVLHLSISQAEALRILWEKGFREVNVDLVDLARSCVGKARYRRGAGFYEAPFTVDCSTLTKWLYSQAGIWLPRHSIDQRQLGQDIPRSEITTGDLIFTKGARSYWYNDEGDGVGHVGIYTGDGTVIHASNATRGVVEDTLEIFIGDERGYRGIRRIKSMRTITLESPSNRIVECSWEFRHILQQIVHKKPDFPEVCHPFE